MKTAKPVGADLRADAALEPGVAAAAALAVLVWAGTPIATRWAVAAVDPLAVGIMRPVLGGLVAFPLALALRLPRPPDRAAWALLVTAALGGAVIFPILFSLGMRDTSAAHAGLILASLPVFTGLIVALVDRRLPPGRWWLGAAVALAGETLLVSLRYGDLTEAPGSLRGDLVVLVSSVASSGGYVAGGRLARRMPSLAITFWGVTVGAVVALPLLLLTDVHWTAVDAGGWAAIHYLALGSTVLAYIAWYWALDRGGIVRIATWQFAQPMVTVGLAALLLGEPVNPPLLLAGTIILFGIWLARPSGRRRP
jgi:drug/metabolite transporter (DMT)-like permease